MAPGASAFRAIHVVLAAAIAQGGLSVLVRTPAQSPTPSAAQAVTPISTLAGGHPERLTGRLAPADLTPLQFLVISSPRERKIVYTELKNFRSSTGRTYTLVDSGLVEPADMALDRQNGKLYVADTAQRSVFRYNLLLDASGTKYHLRTDGTRLTVLVNRRVGGLTVDTYGTLFFTDENASSVNKVPATLMTMLAASDVAAEDLGVITQRQLEDASSRQIQGAMVANEAHPSDAPAQQAAVQALYEAAETPEVAAPAGVASDGMRLYWSNARDGRRHGAVVAGEATPHAPLLTAHGGRMHFPASVLANSTDGANCLIQTSSMLIYASEAQGSGSVFGTSKSGGPVFRYVTGLGQPRGLAWDGDNTAYVADAGGSRVYSFPVNRHIDGAPVVPVVDFNGAYGLALVSSDDEAWHHMLPYSSAHRAASLCWVLACTLLGVVVSA